MSPSRSAIRVVKMRGFTFVELMVIIVMIGLIAGLILPALAKSKEKASAYQCVDNGRTIGAAFQKYADENDGAVLPAKLKDEQAKNWTDILNDYVKDHNVWHCPCCRSGSGGHFGVGYNHHLSKLKKLSAIRQPKATVAFGDTGEIANPDEKNPNLWVEKETATDAKPVLLFETPADADWKTSRNRMVNRHLGRASVIFVDGHVDLRPVRKVGFQHPEGHARAMWDDE